MRMMKILAAVALVGMISPLALAQDKTEKDPKKEDRKTESEKKDEGKSETKVDRGDKKAEDLFKRAYTRVYSAESKGLTKLHAGSDISVDATAMGFGQMPFEGEVFWKSGGAAIWKSTEEEGASSSPLGNLSDIAKGLFEPYLGYVTGFESYDVRFKKANFAFGDPVMDEKDEKKEIAKTVIVTYIDSERKVETFTVAENKVKTMAHETELQGQKAEVTFAYEYEDQGKNLRLSAVNAETEVDMSGLPGQEPDPKNPVPKGESKQKLEGQIKVSKYGKVGEYELALEMEATLKFNMMGQEMSFPATLSLSDAKINDDVKDDDFPEEAKGNTDDDEF
ncbi:MAG: hypothetical protein KDB68_05730 [Planctomycetes bacterium]|nr:hypothetical protein [Planctomycetota bacterium]MCA8935688.1 hypothetical protein [Planctomycetota bacterium]